MNKLIDYHPGDIVSIPLTDGRLAIGRIYDDATIAIFNRVETAVPALPEIAQCEVVFFAAFFDTSIRNGDWPILGNLPFDHSEDRWPPARFVRDILDPLSFQIYERGDLRPADVEEIKGLDEFKMYKPDQLVKKIENELLETDPTM